jgi:hypothetical protein
LIPFGIVVVLTLLAWVWLHKVKRPSFMGVKMGFMCVHKEHFEHYVLSNISAAIPFLTIVYNNVCLKGFGARSTTFLRAANRVAPPGRLRQLQAGLQVCSRACR